MKSLRIAPGLELPLDYVRTGERTTMTTPKRYAEGTSVSVADSRSAIERLIRQHNATGFASSWDRDRYCIMFELRGRRVRFDVGAPDPKKYRDQKKWEAEERRRWRALLLLLKAKLEIVASEDADLDSEFLAYLVLPNGESVGQRVLPEIDRVLGGAPMPPLLAMGETGDHGPR